MADIWTILYLFIGLCVSFYPAGYAAREITDTKLWNQSKFDDIIDNVAAAIIFMGLIFLGTMLWLPFITISVVVAIIGYPILKLHERIFG